MAKVMHAASEPGFDLFNMDKPIAHTGKTLCGIPFKNGSTENDEYVYPSMAGLAFVRGKHEPCAGGSTVAISSLKDNPSVCQQCVDKALAQPENCAC